MNSVTVYTTTQCPYCVMLKNFLSEQNIPFIEVNVETQPEVMQRLVKTTGQMGVPQTEVNGQWIVGFDPNNIMIALRNGGKINE
ncbi:MULTISPECIES: glutaredoxin family protein [Psychrobacillus]|uniref:Glutaredoxin family protein n=1 Tax=Psychrobacillus lasiicapitis TaxID=1636719 RepID=A0A544TCE9_9BACI|nr:MULTISPECIES: glutaredoxin domain-containing protein [Psychrobacillus]MDI2589427.1 glutaredoxin family protein [Psychrobacillus sp. NEAU-3TGS]TQR15125.1 glutaredoxin family protein [Psychrobacillus lasiicapitis]GGA22671.1 glutaredoxin 3 [Psychrobacillus lasiicapitis]